MNFLNAIKKLTNRLFGAKTKGETEMAKTDVVATGLKSIQDGEVQVYTDALGAAYEGGFTEGVASVPPGTGGIDQSVVDGLNQQIADLQAKDAADIQAGNDALATLQTSFDALAAKESGEAATVANFQAAKEKLAACLASLASVDQPTPDPVPVDPAPVDPAPVDPAA